MHPTDPVSGRPVRGSADHPVGGPLCSSADDELTVLRETLDALELPRHGLAKFFDHNRAFCNQHGGRRVYGELLALLDRCDHALASKNGAKR